MALEQAVRDHPRRTLLATWALLACGVTGAGFLASSTYFAAQARSLAGFRATAASLSASVLTAVRRDEDFVVSQAAMVEAMPGITNAFYRRWMQGVDLGTRYPGGLGSTYVARVPAGDLHGFAVALAKDPMAGLSVPAPSQYHPWPPGWRPDYCLMRIAYSVGRLSSQAVGTVPATFDFCAPLGPASPFPGLFAAATDSGSVAVSPPISVYRGVFYVIAPVYKGASLPSALAQRKAEVAGWMMGSFSAAETLRAALGQVSAFGVKLAYSEPSLAGSPTATSLVASLGPARGPRPLLDHGGQGRRRALVGHRDGGASLGCAQPGIARGAARTRCIHLAFLFHPPPGLLAPAGLGPGRGAHRRTSPPGSP